MSEKILKYMTCFLNNFTLTKFALTWSMRPVYEIDLVAGLTREREGEEGAGATALMSWVNLQNTGMGLG